MHKAVTKIASCRVNEISERDIENVESCLCFNKFSFRFLSKQPSIGLKVANLKSGLCPLVTVLEPLYKTKACN